MMIMTMMDGWWWCSLCTRRRHVSCIVYTVISLKQHSMSTFFFIYVCTQTSTSVYTYMFAGRHVVPLGHIILIPSQPVFALTPKCCVISGEAVNTNFIVIGLTWRGLGPTVYRTRGKHTTDNHYKHTLCVHTLLEGYETIHL